MQNLIFVVLLIVYPVIQVLHHRLRQKNRDLVQANLGILESLANAAAKRDSDTSTHNYRVTLYAINLGIELGLSDIQIRQLIKGAFLHDVGKIGVADAVLLKDSALSADEFREMKAHVELGVDILKHNAWLEDALEVVAYHHEKYDGSGYPYGLKGESIPLVARIFTLVDVFDALTSKRPYKEAFACERSVDMLEGKCAGQFDPELLRVFARIARSLYLQINQSSEAELREQLRRQIDRYF